MRDTILSILRCPRCRGEFKVQPGGRRSSGSLVHGHLACSTCMSVYGVRNGIPDMINPGWLHKSSRQGFSYQWSIRDAGAAETSDVIYGYRISRLVRWAGEVCLDQVWTEPGETAWLLDAGCGSAEKAAEIARRYPNLQVLAMDQSTMLPVTAARFSHIENLHFVQGDVVHPPVAPSSLAAVVSIGVLHHTHATRPAFDAVATLVRTHGTLFVWLYPAYGEDPFWDGLYRQRDLHFLGLGSRLPAPVVRAWCRVYVRVFRKQIKKFFVESFQRNSQIFPPQLYAKFKDRQAMIRSAEFLSFDNVMPRFQFRHNKGEVTQWYLENGFAAPETRYPGFFFANRLHRHPVDVVAEAPVSAH